MMARIVILGCAGAGKTTLSRRLGDRIHVPVICLDAVWRTHCGGKDVAAFRAVMEQAHAGDQWISDGNFAQATFDIRLPRATLVLWVEGSKLSCAWRAIKRVFKPGGDHKINALVEVLAFIWNFDRVNRPRIEALRIAHGPGVPVRRLTSDREMSAVLALYGYGSD